MRIVFTDDAQLKLANIFDYLTPHTDFNFAISHIEKIKNQIVDKLSAFPRSGVPYRGDLQRKTTVKVGAAHYSVLYQIHEAENTLSVYQIYAKGEDW